MKLILYISSLQLYKNLQNRRLKSLFVSRAYFEINARLVTILTNKGFKASISYKGTGPQAKVGQMDVKPEV